MKHMKTISSPRLADNNETGPIKKIIAELEEFIGDDKEDLEL